jgi:hypothetical protein
MQPDYNRLMKTTKACRPTPPVFGLLELSWERDLPASAVTFMSFMVCFMATSPEHFMTSLIPQSPLFQFADSSERLIDGASQVIPVMAEVAQMTIQLEHTGTVRFRKVVHREAQTVENAGFRDVVDAQRIPVNQVV